MKTLRLIVPALCLTAGLAGLAAHAQPPAPDASPPGAAWHGPHHGGEFGHILKGLDLSAEQKTQIKSIFEQAKPQMKSLHESGRTNHEALLAAAPTDPNYPSLLATEKNNAAARVQFESDLKTQVYAVLTPAQQAKVPALIAAARAKHEAQMASWKGAQ